MSYYDEFIKQLKANSKYQNERKSDTIINTTLAN